MSNIHLIITSCFYAALCLMLIYRVAKGPHAVDRVVAGDTIDSITVVIMVLYGAISNRGIYLDIALIVSLLGFISTVAISKYLEGRL
ncbi:MAG: monovalent cation/H+ antiporter complex subunit F [Clostridiales bacterium]|nr:monovalent cation/H+ antiporter complex subunit F [Clostridiales bacterium]